MSPALLLALSGCIESVDESREPRERPHRQGHGWAITMDGVSPDDPGPIEEAAEEEPPPDLGEVGDSGVEPGEGDPTGAGWKDSPFVQIAGGDGTIGVLCADGWIDGFGYALNLIEHDDYTRVAVGGGGMCGVRLGGAADCEYARSNWTSGGGESYTDVAMETGHCCFVNSTEGVSCSGWNEYADEPPAKGEYTSVTVGANSECALDAHGEIECWAGPDAETSLPRGPFRQIALFDADMGGCGLHAAGDIVCWLSDLTPDDGQYLAIAVEDRSLCAIDIDGALHCWGDDISSPPAGTFMQVAMAGSYACALDDAGAIQCWSDRELDPHLYPPDSLCVEPASGPW